MRLLPPSLLLLVLFISTATRGDAATCPSGVPLDEACPQGCYHVSGGGYNADGTRPCRPVGEGNYSPPNDNRRYPCEFGTFSAIDTAGACSSCPAGTHVSSAKASQCRICPIGTYSNLPRSIFCSPCDPETYGGEGANSIQVWNGKVFCSLIPGETDPPTPTMAPTLMSTSQSPTTEVPRSISGISANATILQLDATDPEDDEDEWCLQSEYEWHGECTSCPSTLRTILHPIWMVALVVSIVVAISIFPETSTAIIWMGIEYLQLAYYLGLISSTPSPSESPQELALLEHLYRWILSIFVLDLDAGLSWQCLLGLSPAFDHMFVLVLPMIVACSVWILSQAIPAIHVSRMVAVGFSLGHLKFVLTSLEALHCSGRDWFCHEPLLSSVMGIIGLVVYGGLAPGWLLWKRYSHSKPSEDETWSHDILPSTDSWWWPGFWMIRRSFLATLPVVLSEHPSWILTALLVILMASELIQRFASPFGDCDHQNRWFRTSTVDTILQASLIALTGLKFLALAMPPETMRADGVAIEVLFLTAWIPSVMYWMAAMLFHHIQSRQVTGMDEVHSHDDAKSTTSASTTSSHQRKQSLPPPPSLRDITASIKDSYDDAAIRPNLSLIPHLGPGDDLDMETVLENEESGRGGGGLSDRLAALQFSEWAGTRDSAMRSVLRSQPIGTTPSSSYTDPEDYFPSSLPSDGGSFLSSPPVQTDFDFDDTSTLTDNNSYVKQSHYQRTSAHHRRQRPKKHWNSSVFSDPDGVASIVDSSGDETPMIFVDDEETPPQVEYHIPHQYRSDAGRNDESLDPDGDNDEEDDLTEVWIDEATGLPVKNKESGEWADVRTGLPVDTESSSSASSSSLPSSRSSSKDQKSQSAKDQKSQSSRSSKGEKSRSSRSPRMRLS